MYVITEFLAVTQLKLSLKQGTDEKQVTVSKLTKQAKIW